MLPVKEFIDFADQNNLFEPGDKILAAVSGGMDSVLLVHLLKAAGFNFSIAHCNFQLRGDESLNDQQFCEQLAQQLQVTCYTKAFDTLAFAAAGKLSVQMAARRLRYEWFEHTSRQYGYPVVALAHHQNDAIETILLNLTRGTGIAGLHGIMPRNGMLVRPLLFLDRNAISDIVRENKISYVEDSSNSSVKYARNRIRLEIVPVLKKLNPSLEHTFQGNLRHFRELELLLEQRLKEIKKDLFVQAGDEIHLSLAALRKLEPKHLLLFRLLQPYGFNEATVNDVISSLDKQPGKTFISPAYRLILDRETLILKGLDEPALPEVTINEHDHEVQYGNYRLTLLRDDSPLIVKNNPLAFSADSAMLIFPLTLRSWKQGDHFYPIGMNNRKKLSDYFIGQKVSLHTKSRVPLLVNGNGEMIWIGGYRPDDRYKVTANTKKVTIFELFKI